VVFINTAVIFAFGLLITGIVSLGVWQARDQLWRLASSMCGFYVGVDPPPGVVERRLR
jgi:hypothetical protein